MGKIRLIDENPIFCVEFWVLRDLFGCLLISFITTLLNLNIIHNIACRQARQAAKITRLADLENLIINKKL